MRVKEEYRNPPIEGITVGNMTIKRYGSSNIQITKQTDEITLFQTVSLNKNIDDIPSKIGTILLNIDGVAAQNSFFSIPRENIIINNSEDIPKNFPSVIQFNNGLENITELIDLFHTEISILFE